ncbi:Uncharacterized protein C14C4.10c [Erysiphe neolycopersici]|uniref:Uncharacterized protein C14C4.10c n=1 Tax=Erysiphe neolycopersici TaxID=212602 RepID=A0A420HVB3_9PEZI|nr:Uncharacterized protein C14C4.10c [Erysiphe neolycopersici]
MEAFSNGVNLINSLRDALTTISQTPCEHVDNSEKAKRRASVALIIRIRPHFNHWPKDEIYRSESNESFDLPKYFATPWVQNGDPEVIFIKRAAREGDRWTSHIALPGGKKDPEDTDDKSVAIRETAEEIGLDLTSPNATYIGKLPERLILTALGTIPILTLCPFVFLWTKPVLPPLQLQPGEVASIHWVPLRIMLSSSSRTYKYIDSADRILQRGGPVSKIVLQSLLGSIQFSAIELLPSESLHCTSSEEFFPRENLIQLQSKKSFFNRIFDWGILGKQDKLASNDPLLLWGLTLGIFVDFLHLLPASNAIELWSYPTFTNYDVQLIVSILTWSLRRRNKDSLKVESGAKLTAIDDENEAVPIENSLCVQGLDGTTEVLKKSRFKNQSHIVGILLDGYYDMLRRGAIIAAGLRVASIFSLAFIIVKSYKRK